MGFGLNLSTYKNKVLTLAQADDYALWGWGIAYLQQSLNHQGSYI